jgi:hypothetical protein
MHGARSILLFFRLAFIGAAVVVLVASVISISKENRANLRRLSRESRLRWLTALGWVFFLMGTSQVFATIRAPRSW